MSSLRLAFPGPSGLLLLGLLLLVSLGSAAAQATPRERSSLNAGWRFIRFANETDHLSYDTLKAWILPSSNDFITRAKYQRPSGTPPGSNVSYVQESFDDSKWDPVTLPHDWAIKGPFGAPGISGSEGSLPYDGVGWYRKTLKLESGDVAAGKKVYLEVDGAMSYASVFLNGVLIGGWPYGYNSFRLDLTSHAKAGNNTLAIRLENKPNSSRWYPGAGLYRNVWLVKVNSIHVAQYGTKVTTPSVSEGSADVDLSVTIENTSNSSKRIDLITEIYEVDASTGKATGDAKATFDNVSVDIAGGGRKVLNGTTKLSNPKLWGPAPEQTPSQYVAISKISASNSTVDVVETKFGVRTIVYDGNKGLVINGESIYVRGVCNHHDLGALGAAFNTRAAERQLEILLEMGTNALRTSHNMPASELLDLADRFGILVMGETFDTWKTGKTDNDYHLLWDEWHEADMRAYVRRERNHPSIVAWSIGNEMPDQSSALGGQIGKELQDIARQEDGTRKSTAGLNNAGPGTALVDLLEIPGLNYQGEGKGNSTSSTYPTFHSKYPSRMLWGTETASTVSTRGTYIFPVTSGNSAIVGSTAGENTTLHHVSSYDLYHPSWAASPDKVFLAQDKYPYVAGEFVWTGWDYLGEPTPFENDARSSYFGIVDLAGFKKDRFSLYQARWRPEFAQAHILPHWTWPSSREGLVTPVHVFTSGDEAELFVNGKSAGRKNLPQSEYRVRWDNVTYMPGELHVVAYKDGKKWAEDTKRTVGAAAKLNVTADRTTIGSDGYDLSFVTVAVVDANGDVVPQASDAIGFSVEGPGEIVATDNGDPTDMTAFPELTRKAFSGLALAIVRAKAGEAGEITVAAAASGLESGEVVVHAG